MGKHRATEGSFIKVPFNEKFHTYARVIAEKSFAFYDARTNQELTIGEIKNKPVLFIVPVFLSVVNSGRWTKIGTLPLESHFQKNPPMFMQDILLDPNILHIYENAQMKPASRKECEGLERFAVWEAEHIESRLNDYYAGRPNVWVEHTKLK